MGSQRVGHDWATELNWTEVYSMPTFWRDFIISRCWFCQKLSLYLLRWLYGFYLSVYWSEKAMAPHSSTLAWKIPRMEEPGGLQSKGLRRVGHDWATSLSLFTFMHWRRKWQPTPVFLPGESQGRGSLVGFCLWGHKESDMTEVTYMVYHIDWFVDVEKSLHPRDKFHLIMVYDSLSVLLYSFW